MSGAVVDIVTGASHGIGLAISECVASRRASQMVAWAADGCPAHTPETYLLVMTGRNVHRGMGAAERVRGAAGDRLSVCFEPCDHGDYGDVLRLRDRIGKRAGAGYRVGILVNNAAECPRKQQFVERMRRNVGGEEDTVRIDRQFATNVLGYHFMMKAFSENFFPDAKTHVVNISSTWAGDLDLADLSFSRRGYDNDAAYRQSKQCDRMLTKAWSSRLRDRAFVNSCHPGDPCTTLSTDLGYNMGSPPPSRSAIEETPIPFLCGLKGDGGNVLAEIKTTGAWFPWGKKPSRCQFAHLTKETELLFEICESFACL